MAPRVLHYSDLENAYDTPERAARVAGLLAERRDSGTLVAGSGDNTGPGVLSLVTDGRQSLDFFATVDPHVETVGNHDLDNGVESLCAVIDESPQRWLLANVSVGGDRLCDSAGVEAAATVDVGGTAVGVVGVIDPATPEMTPGLDALEFRDPVAAVDRHAAHLRAGAAEYAVALAHTSDDIAERIARETAVDAVLAGHSHDRRAGVVGDTPLTRPGATGTYVYELDLESGAITRHETASAAPDERVESALTERVSAAGLDEVVARVDEPLERGRDHRRNGEWRLGNFVADAYRWKTGADVGVQNAGGIREGPPLSGAVTVADLVSVSPFDEPVVVASVTGAELHALAREADGRLVDGTPDSWIGHVSGISITAVDGGYEATVDGRPADPDAEYAVAVPDFLLVTDREFPTLTESHRVESYDRQYDVIVEYAREKGIDPSLDGRLPDVAAVGDRDVGPGDAL